MVLRNQDYLLILTGVLNMTRKIPPKPVLSADKIIDQLIDEKNVMHVRNRQLTERITVLEAQVRLLRSRLNTLKEQSHAKRNKDKNNKKGREKSKRLCREEVGKI